MVDIDFTIKEGGFMENMKNVAIIDISEYKKLVDQGYLLHEDIKYKEEQITDLTEEINKLKDEYRLIELKIFEDIQNECNNAVSNIEFDDKTSYYYQVLVNKLQEKGYISLDRIDEIIKNLIINSGRSQVEDEE